ncbi:MAG TPA: methyltransferase domain-containing protein [Thermomicrobiales bacterium]|nr:methyltransferase domain-containing protein [Thermomicrobiales bacterium]
MSVSPATPSKEWDATTYHRVSNPHVAWGARVLERLPLRGDETVLDAGCGTGRLTEELLERLPRGRVIAVDRSRNMLDRAAAQLTPKYGDRIAFIEGDLRQRQVDEPVDAIFSTATFHWIGDHDALFAVLNDQLKPGGRLVAQCGGGPNLVQLRERLDRIAQDEPFRSAFGDWPGPWRFATPEETAGRLATAGFTDIETGLEYAPATMESPAAYREFLRTVILHPYLERLPNEADRDALLDRLTAMAADDEPALTFDYWRLNISARRPPESW